VPVVPLKQIVDRAFSARYGVAAINVVNDLTLEAVLAAAVEQRSPVIVQTSVKTVRTIGIDLLFAMWQQLTAGIKVPVSLHLDHCPDRAFISSCLRKGWNSVLFDGSTLPVALEFIRTTGIDVFAPAIGNAHGVYHTEPHLDAQRVSDIVAAQPIPIALHGGTGMTDAQFTDLIARGCAKVNISTALKVTYMKANLAFLRGAEERDSWDPPSLFSATRTAVKDMAADHMRRFGSVGRAW